MSCSSFDSSTSTMLGVGIARQGGSDGLAVAFWYFEPRPHGRSVGFEIFVHDLSSLNAVH